MTERKKTKIPTGIYGILPCIFLLPFFLLFVAVAAICSLLDSIIRIWERKSLSQEG